MMRDLIGTGLIGQVKAIWCRHFISSGGDRYFKDWQADRSRSLGLLVQAGCSDFDVIHWMADGYTSSVSAVGALSVYGQVRGRRQPDTPNADPSPGGQWPPGRQRGLNAVISVEDVSMANLVLDNGVLASYQQCHYSPDEWRNYTVIGTKGRMENFGDRGGAVVKVWTRRGDTYREDSELGFVVPSDEVSEGADSDAELLREFVNFAREGTPVEACPVAARQAVAATAMATRSLRSRGIVLDVPLMRLAVQAWFEAGQLDRRRIATVGVDGGSCPKQLPQANRFGQRLSAV